MTRGDNEVRKRTHGNGSGVGQAQEETEHKAINEHEKVEVAHCPVAARHTKQEANAADESALLRADLGLDTTSEHHRHGLTHDANSIQPRRHVGSNALSREQTIPPLTALPRQLWMYEIM